MGQRECITIKISPFPNIEKTKEQANKILEEAAEAYTHAMSCVKYTEESWQESHFITNKYKYMDEMIDCIQALINFASVLYDDDYLQKAIDKAENTVTYKNVLRGHYE
ncbi:MAG: hypothetical protein LIR46_02485 [Bacteroidota bacterium]|nr:hypothetical protein [Bacteroidota bacterium]